MADTFEKLHSCPDKVAVVDVAITEVVSSLWVVSNMLPEELNKVSSIIETCRDELNRIRGQVNDILTTRSPKEK